MIVGGLLPVVLCCFAFEILSGGRPESLRNAVNKDSCAAVILLLECFLMSLWDCLSEYRVLVDGKWQS